MSHATRRAQVIWRQTSWQSGRWPHMRGPRRRRPLGPALGGPCERRRP